MTICTNKIRTFSRLDYKYNYGLKIHWHRHSRAQPPTLAITTQCLKKKLPSFLNSL